MTKRNRIGLVAGLAMVAAVGWAAASGRPQPKGPGTRPPTGNVRDHGAKGDGTTDDWQAVQNAVDERAGVVHFPPGTYRITKPVVIDLDTVGFTAIKGETVARVVMA